MAFLSHAPATVRAHPIVDTLFMVDKNMLLEILTGVRIEQKAFKVVVQEQYFATYFSSRNRGEQMSR